MSFNGSDFLKYRDQQMQKAGGEKPPADSSDMEKDYIGYRDQQKNDFAREYISFRNRRGDMSLSDIVELRVQGMTAGTGMGGTSQSSKGGSYYSMPQIGTEYDRYERKVTEADKALAEQATLLQSAQEALTKASTTLQALKSDLDKAKAAYNASPTTANMDNYNKIVADYNAQHQVYTDAYNTYDTAYQTYKPYEDSLVDALFNYRVYGNRQQDLYNQWRSTVRDPAAVKQEIDAIDAQIKKLEREDTNAFLEVLGAAAAAGALGTQSSVMYQPRTDTTARLKELRAQRDILQEEYDWGQYFPYADLRQAEDFEEKSKYASTANGKEKTLHPVSGLYTETGFGDLTYDYINRNPDAQGIALVNGVADNRVMLGLDESYLKEMSDDEISIFNYLYATKGPDAAYEYTAYLTKDLNWRQRQKAEAQWAAFAKDSPVKASAFSVLTSPLKGLSYLGQMADYTADGEIDQNAGYNKFSYSNSAIRGAVAQKIEESGKWGKVGSFAYQTGMSMGDFLLNSAITGGNQALSLALMGSGAAADTVISARDQGVDSDKAFLLGTIAGAAEIITEKVSLDALLDADLLKDSMGKYILKNMIAEGSEEVGSDIINLVADVIVSKDQSQWQKSIDAYMAAGKTRQEAFGCAMADQAKQMGLDFLGGALSGGIMGGGNALIQTNNTNKLGQQIAGIQEDMESVEAFIETGLESDPGSAAYQMAQQMQQKLQKGEAISNQELSKLWQANMQAIQEEEKATAGKEENTAPVTDTVEGGTEKAVEGLQMPTAEGIAQDADRENGPVAGTQAVQTAETEPQTWQETVQQQFAQAHDLNGGTEYENAQRRAQGPADAQTGAGGFRTGAGISDGSQERPAGVGTGEQAGGMETGAVKADSRAQRVRIIGDRRARAKSIRAETVSSRELGITSGTDTKANKVLTQEIWDDRLRAAASRAMDETGCKVTFVLGRIQVRGADGAIRQARGVYIPDENGGPGRIIVQADHMNVDEMQLVKHESLHAMRDNYGQRLINDLRTTISEQYTREEYRNALLAYREALYGMVDMTEEGAEKYLEEELLADAYAGIDISRFKTSRFTETVNKFMTDAGIGNRAQAQSNGTRQTNGPNSQAVGDLTGGERNSISETYFEELSAWDAAGRPSGETFILGTTGDVLQGLGAIESDIYIHGDKVNTILEQHPEMTLEEIKRIPEVLDDPVLVLKSKGQGHRNNSRLVLFGSLKASNGKPVLCVLDLRPVENHLLIDNMQKVNSTYTKDHGDDFILSSDVLYADKKRTIPLLRSTGLTTMSRELLRDGSMGSISYQGRNVKIEGVPFAGIIETQEDDTFTDQVRRQIAERFSYAGEHADNADLDALAQAKELQEAGVADETEDIQPLVGLSLPSLDDDSGNHYDGYSMTQSPEIYTYEFLTSQPDMHIVMVPDLRVAKGLDGKVKQGIVAAEGMKNARSVGTERDGKIFVQNRYSGRNLRVDNAGLRHSLTGDQNRLYTNARLGCVAGELIQNAIPINALHNTVDGVEGTYAMAGYAVSNDGREYVAIITVEQRRDSVTNIEAFDVTHSVSGRQKRSSQADSVSSPQGVYPSMSASEISIADFISAVNSTYQSILSEDVLDHFGAIRSPDGYYSSRVRYSVDDSDAVLEDSQGRELTAHLEMDADYGPQMATGVYNPSDAAISANIRTVATMDPVSAIAGTEFAKGETDLVTQVGTFFDSIGNVANSPDLGEVILDRRGIKSDIAHGIGRKKAAAFAAVPDVIQEGLVVDYQRNWKGRGYDTAVVAAPITIGGEPHYAAVILTRSDLTNRFYVHEVIAEKNGAMPFKTGTRKGNPSGDAPSILSILERIRGVNSESTERLSVGEDSQGRELTAEQAEYFRDSIVRDEQGRLIPVYHGTDALFNEFSYDFINKHGSGEGRGFYFTDNRMMAEGYEMKTGRVMEGYLDIRKPLSNSELTVTRQEVQKLIKAIDPTGDEILSGYDSSGIGYPSAAWYNRAMRETLDMVMTNDSDSELLAELANACGDNRAVMEAARNTLGYDGYIERSKYDDATVYVVFDSSQFKNVDNRNPTRSKDIRYSMDYYEAHDDPEGREDYGKVMEEMGAKAASERNAIRRQEEKKQAERAERERNTEKKQAARAKAREERQQRAKIAREEIRGQIARAGKPYNESKPQIAKKEFRSAVIKMFSIPEGNRAELGTLIDSVADRLIKKGSLTAEDRNNLLDRLYESGVMTVPAEELYRDFRGYAQGGRIYVPGSVVSELGDDWNDIRRRAFSVGIYLVRDQAKGASGIDVWNQDLAGELPGLFDSEETDLRNILERIIQVAEEGKDEKMSLPEYARWLAGKEGSTENEFLDSMERQFDWALRTFAEKARLEIRLRDREGMIVAREREKASEARYMEAYREQLRRTREREARKESAQRQKARKELQELQQRTLKTLRWLSENRNRAPEELRDAWDEALGDIDLYAVSTADEMRWSDKHNATWKDLAQMYKDAQKNDPNFMPTKELERIVTRLDGTKIADMDLGALQDLYKAAIGLRTEFYNRNNVINDEMQRLFAEVYTDTKGEIENAPGGFTGNKLDKFVNLDQLTPMNVMQRMGGWDPDGAFYSMAKQLERGERDLRAYKVRANRMLESFLNEHQDWMKVADGQGKDGIWYELEVPELLELHMGDKPIFGPTVKVYMTPAQKVHMYLESKNLDNLRHMTGGRTFADKELYSQGKRQEALSQGKTIRLAPETVRQIVSDLTPEEQELADLLNQYYNSFATKEINRVSNILYGYDKAMGKNYAPIYTNQNYTKSEFGVFDVTAEGVGNLKGRQYAVNPSYNISAFEAFERHTDQTARFVGMAIPTRNWTTLMNWREMDNSTGDVITHKWGEESKRYITDLITTLQGGDTAKTDTVSAAANKVMSNYISAVFGANPSIVLKQLGSIPMAGAYLDFKNFPSVSQIRNIDRELIAKYSQDLAWRTMGYSMPETKQMKDNPNWTQTNKVFKFIFGGDAITAMDGWAASTLWPWAENKVRKEHPELEIGTQEQIDKGESPFYKKVAEEFENALARSQSTSDEIHQGALRKSSNPVTRAFTLFRSDSAQTYNTIRQKIGEAQYYMRTGSEDTVIQAAKKAAGSAFCAMLLNAAWSEAITFLMALWKHKDKRYRDDEEELTAGSVAGEMVSGMVGALLGAVTGGEELYEIIGNIITGEKWYGIDTPGMEQMNEAIEAIIESGGSMREIVAGAADILKNGGNLGQYFGDHSGEILGNIKELASTVATYLPGLPVDNLEAYLLGAIKWASPELGTAYDDLFADVGKTDMSGLKGDSLKYRLGEILGQRHVTDNEGTIDALAALYQEGFRGAVPGDIPSSISVNGENQALGTYQQQAYGNIWSSVVAEGLDDMVSSQAFADGDAATKTKMLEKLYDYAAERAKAALFDEYEMSASDAENAKIIAAGVSVAECMIWNTTTGKIGDKPAMKSGEKAGMLAEWEIPEEAKKAIFEYKITDSKEETIEAFRTAGLSFDQFLDAYSMYSGINGMDAKAGEKAARFANWIAKQGYSTDQAAVVRDKMAYFNMTPASAEQYDDLLDRGLDPDDALDLMEDFNDALEEIELEDGQTSPSDLQKWRVCVEFSDDVDDQLAALSMVMTDSQMAKADLANYNGIMPIVYVDYLESRIDYDADGSGTLTQPEVKAAIDSMSGLSTAQRAVLWQLSNKSWKAEKNPYDRKVGQGVIDSWE